MLGNFSATLLKDTTVMKSTEVKVSKLVNGEEDKSGTYLSKSSMYSIVHLLANKCLKLAILITAPGKFTDAPAYRKRKTSSLKRLTIDGGIENRQATAKIRR